MVIYTDGSGISGKIGAAAYNTTTEEVSLQHLGSETHYNVYAAELTAISMAVTLWEKQIYVYPKCQIFTDSQSAGRSISQPRRQSGQSIIKSIIDQVDDITHQNPELHPELEILWIPGHHGIDGNERVDGEAKRAAVDPPQDRPFNHKPLKSTQAQYIKREAKNQWQKEWSENRSTAPQLRAITKRRGATYGPKLYNNITSRSSCSIIAQLRTGHCGLNKYLHRFGKTHSPYCKCGYGKETVEHFLLECRNYKEQRKLLKKNVGTGKMKTDKLLGDAKLLKHTLEYIKTTGRLVQTI